MDFIKHCQALVYDIERLLDLRKGPGFPKLLEVLSGVEHHLEHFEKLCPHASSSTENQRPWILRWVLYDFEQNLEECKNIVGMKRPDKRAIDRFIQQFAVDNHKLRTLVSASSWKACQDVPSHHYNNSNEKCVLCTWNDYRVPCRRSRCDLIANFIRTTIETNCHIPAEQELASTAIEFLYNPENIEHTYAGYDDAFDSHHPSSISRRINALVHHVNIAAYQAHPDRSNIQWLRLMTCFRILAVLKGTDEYKNSLENPISGVEHHLQERGITLLSFITEIELELFGIVSKYSESTQEQTRRPRADNPMSPSFTRKAASELVAEFQWTMPLEEKIGGLIPIYTGHAYLSEAPVSLGFRLPEYTSFSPTIAVKPITDTLLSLHSGSDLLYKELNRGNLVMCLGDSDQSPTLKIGHSGSPSLALLKFATIYPDMLLFEEAITNHQVLVHCPIVSIETTRRRFGLFDVKHIYDGTLQLWLWLELSESRRHACVMPAHSGSDSRGSSSVEPKAPLLVFVGKCRTSSDPVMLSISLEEDAFLETNHSHVTIMAQRGRLKQREYENEDQNIALLGSRGCKSKSGNESNLNWVQISFGRSNAEDKRLFRQRCNEALDLYKVDLHEHRENTRGQPVYG